MICVIAETGVLVIKTGVKGQLGVVQLCSDPSCREVLSSVGLSAMFGSLLKCRWVKLG